MQWLQDPNHSNLDNLNDLRPAASRHCRNKKKKHLKAKFYELETDSKIKNITGLYRVISDFKMGYQLILIQQTMRSVIWLQTPIIFRLGRGVISLSYLTYWWLQILDRQKYVQQNHSCLCPVILTLRRIYTSYLTADLQTLHFKYLLNKYNY